MTTLIFNQHLGRNPVEDTMGNSVKPNCLGTAFFIAGVGKFDHPYCAYDRDLGEHIYLEGDEHNNPLLRHFRQHLHRRIPGAFVFSYSCDDWHAGIYLGQIEEEPVAFAQHGIGKGFGPEVIANNFVSPDYYLPRTLREKT